MQCYLERIASIIPSRVLPGRLRYIFSMSVKSKTSDYFAIFGPHGTAMLAQLQDMPARCKNALVSIVQAAGDIWDKTPRW